MAFEPVGNTGTIGLKGKEVGTQWIGTYKTKETVPSTYNKDQNQNVWGFVGKDGNSFKIWGCASLDKQMNDVSVNSVVRITYQGTIPLKGKDVHRVLVEVDKEATQVESAEGVDQKEIPF